MLQITEYNISFKLGFQKHRSIFTTERAWASARGWKRPFALHLGKWAIRTKNV